MVDQGSDGGGWPGRPVKQGSVTQGLVQVQGSLNPGVAWAVGLPGCLGSLIDGDGSVGLHEDGFGG